MVGRPKFSAVGRTFGRPCLRPDPWLAWTAVIAHAPVIASLPFTSSHAEWLGLLVGVVSLVGIGSIVSHLFCHQSGCYRMGRFPHGHYRLCHVHHPNVPSDGKITAEHIAAVETERNQT
jgi:hypothetical protein